MFKRIEVLVLVALSLFFSGCTAVEVKEANLLYKSPVISKNNGQNQFALYRYKTMEEIPVKDPVVWNGVLTGEFLLVKIMGKVKKVELVEISWDGKSLVDSSVLRTALNVENRSILVKTYFADSAPSEKIRITDLNDQVYEYEINEKDLKGAP